MTYYVVAHFHYVLSIGAVFALFARFYYWIPKIIGKTFNENLGRIHFWSIFIGVNITFFPQHYLGLSGIPRRIPDYPDAFYIWNIISSYGSIISVITTRLFSYIIYDIIINGNIVINNPWSIPYYYTSIPQYSFNSQSVSSLEWSLQSPTPYHAFNILPIQ